MNFDDGDLLTNELAPRRRDELQIHNKKLGDVSNLLKSAFPENPGHMEVLYLTGPTGSGKSTAVEVLCKEQQIELIDYSPELLHDDQLECEKPDSTQLIRFLLRRHRSLNGKTKKQVLFVTELPDQSYNDAETFREVLSDALEYIRHPVIFCLTNNIASWHLNPDRIFTREFLTKNHIKTIVFNPVAVTFVKKALDRASKLLRSSLSEIKLKFISEEANGDLRIAMNMLQVNSVGPDANRRTGSKIICASQANKEDVFHMIGRILYAKRVNTYTPKINRSAYKRRKSAPVPEPTERTDLEHDPSDIITMSSMSSEKLVDFLFENEHVFCSDLSKYRHVVEAISYCDVLQSDWDAARTFPDEYTSQIATRTIMWYNFKESRPVTRYAIARPVEKMLRRQIELTKSEVKRLPMIGSKDFSSLTAPYQTIIENIIDPQSIELYLSRPMDLCWNRGKDRLEDQMGQLYQLSFKGRKIPRKSEKRNELVHKNEENTKEIEEETYTIDESSDDSFDEF